MDGFETDSQMFQSRFCRVTTKPFKDNNLAVIQGWARLLKFFALARLSVIRKTIPPFLISLMAG
ncbi:hypothetical protein A3781_13740 [Bacillus badius]|nr:hypothetical protein A3781_13740 [Bacillus badius]